MIAVSPCMIAMSLQEGNPVDRGWAWVVMCAGIGLNALVGGAAYGGGVLNVMYLEAFKDTRANTAWIGALNSSLISSAGIISSILVSRIGFRGTIIIGGLLVASGCFLSAFGSSTVHLVVTYGLISGLGFGLCITPMCAVIGYYFRKYLIIAASVASIGAGIGAFIMAPVLQILADSYHWRSTMMILGAIELHLCVCGTLIRPVRQLQASQCGDNIDKRDQPGILSNYLKLLKNKRYHLMCWCNFFVSVGQFTYYLHLSAYAISYGTRHNDAAFLMSVTGIFSVLSRLTVSFAATDQRIGVLLMAAGTLGLNGLGLLLMPSLMFAYWGQVLSAALFGYYGNAYIPLMTSLTVDVVGLPLLTPAYAGQMLMQGIGILVGPPLAGWVYDITQSYQYGFYMAGILLLLSSACLWCIPIFPSDVEPAFKDPPKEAIPVVDDQEPEKSANVLYSSNYSIIFTASQDLSNSM